jgi:vaccinia related kinase
MVKKITLIDYDGNFWVLDNQLCKGGFGTIYSCVGNDSVVIKTQPLTEKQLRKEERFYLDLKKHNTSSNFIPDLITSGIANNFRFIVIERFPFDLQYYIGKNNLSKREKCNISKQLISAIKYIHMFGYSHGDLKTKNILVKSTNTVCITDFGLIHKFMKKGYHVPYTPGKLALHRGTLPFISEDSHVGAIPSRRSDLENMGWVFISSIFGGFLPWAKTTGKNATLMVKKSTKYFMSNNSDILKKMMPGQSHKRLLQYMIYVIQLGYEDIPNYDNLEQIFS